MRILSLLIQSLFSLWLIYELSGGILYYCGLIFHILSSIHFLMGRLTINSLIDKKYKYYWHKKGYYGFHDDFHILIFIGEIFALINILKNAELTESKIF